MFKIGLTISRFKDFIPIIEKEVRDYLQNWGEQGEVGKYND